MRKVVINLGLSKSGTTSTAAYFRECGFAVSDNPATREEMEEVLHGDRDAYVGDTNASYFLKYGNLRRLPEQTRFLATFRPPESWWWSFRRHFYTRNPEQSNAGRRELMTMLFGKELDAPHGAKTEKAFADHYLWAQKMGAEIINIEEGDCAEQMAKYSGNSEVKFPHLHKSTIHIRDAEKVYAICSPVFPERYKNINEQLEHAYFNEYEEVFVREKSKSEAKDGGWGCKMSHLKAIRQAKELGVNLAVVFEDDVEILNRELKRRELPRKFDIFYLAGSIGGGEQLKTEEDEFVQLTECLGTGALVYNIADAADKIMAEISSDANLPVDVNITKGIREGRLLAKKRIGDWEVIQRPDKFGSTNKNIQ